MALLFGFAATGLGTNSIASATPSAVSLPLSARGTGSASTEASASQLGTYLAVPAISRVLALSSARPVPRGWAQPRPLADARYSRAAIESTNWSGYVASGDGAKFSEVSGTWTVPKVRPGPAGYSSSWVGIDGTATQDLIQAGTEQDWGPQGVVYYAWYELLPGAAMYLGPVYPGDQVSVHIARAGPGTWTIEVDDFTRHTAWAGAVAYSVPGESAEWVEEAPTNGQTSALYPLANFGSVEFSALSVGGPGTTRATISPVYMVTVNNAHVEAYPKRYNPSSDSFDVAFGTLAPRFSGWPASALVEPAGGGTQPVQKPSGAPGAGTQPSTGQTSTGQPGTAKPGYWLVGGDGGVFAFGAARYGGSTAEVFGRPKLPGVTGLAPAPGGGYWLVSATGGVFPLGGAPYLGSVASLNLSAGATPAIAPAPRGEGYYILSPFGDVFAFGDARFEGSCSREQCAHSSAVALVPDSTGDGYWILLADCKVVAFGNASELSSQACQYSASTAGDAVRAAGPAPDGNGFWALLTNGSVYAFGSAANYGHWAANTTSAEAGLGPTAPAGLASKGASEPLQAVAIVPTQNGEGAWLVRSDGSVETLGDATPLGGLPEGAKLNQPIISAAGST